MSVSIRREQPGDERAIRALTDAAFRDMPFADGDEGEVVDRLRADGDLYLSLVALNSDQAIIGHVAFSPISIGETGGQWYQLGPISVIPSGQKSGIGSQLIEHGLAELKDSGAAGVALVGNPDYYERFGFTREHAVSLSEGMDPYLQITAFGSEAPRGQLKLAKAFG